MAVAQRTELLTNMRALLRGGAVANWREGELEIIPRCQDVRGSAAESEEKLLAATTLASKESLLVKTPEMPCSVF